MKVKYEFFILCLILILISLQASAAGEVNQTEPDISANLVGITNYDNEIVGDSGGTFQELQNKINRGGTVNLEENYTMEKSDKEITVTKNVVINGNGHSINANNVSRVFNIVGGSVILNNITFINGDSTENGGFIYGNGTTLTVKNCIFENSSAGCGGAIAIEGSLTVENSSFINNNAFNNSGGSIYLLPYGELEIKDSSFTNNIASDYGGSIYAEESDIVSIIKSIFDNNKAGTQAGAIYLGSSCEVTVDNCTFSENDAPTSAAILISSNSEVTINKSSFTGNIATSQGIITTSNSNLTVLNSNFTYNDALGIYGRNSEIIINNSIFTNNTGINTGVYFQISSVTITDSVFADNYAIDGYRNIFIDSNSFYIITGCTLDINTALNARNIKQGDSEEINGKFDDGTNVFLSQNIELRLNNNNPIRFSLDESKAFNWNFTDLSIGIYTLSVNLLSGEGNNRYINLPFETEFSVVDELKDVIYISPDGNGNGGSSGSATNWKNALRVISNNATIIFSAGSYTNIVNQIISNRNLTLTGTSGVVIDAGNKGRIFTLNYMSNLTVSNILFINGYSATLGGVMDISDNSKVTLRNANFKDNHLNGDGAGVINVKNGNLEIYESDFTSNSANTAGVIQSSNSNIIIYESNFTNNSAKTRAGVIQTSNSNITINKSNFTRNSITVNRYGSSAVFYIDNGNIILNNSIFDNNSNIAGYFSYVSGAIMITGGNLDILNTTFTNNHVDALEASNTDYGCGGVLTISGGNININNSTFNNNNVNFTGAGVIYITNGILNINNSDFLNNYFGNAYVQNYRFLSKSGVFCIRGGNVTIIDSTFDKNHGYSQWSTSYAAGVFTINNGNVNIINCTFSNNYFTGIPYQHYSGGVFCVRGGKVSITDSKFLNNYGIKATRDETASQIKEMHESGGVFCILGGNININNSTFSGNYNIQEQYSSGVSGVFYIVGGNLTINDSYFTKNRGAAVRFQSNLASIFVITKSCEVSILNSRFNGNEVYNYWSPNRDSYGGVGYITNGNIYVFNSTFENNLQRIGTSTGAGVFTLDGGNVTIVSSKFTGNTRANVISNIIKNSGNIKIEDSTIYLTSGISVSGDINITESETIKTTSDIVTGTNLNENITKLVLNNQIFEIDIADNQFSFTTNELQQGYYQVKLKDANNNIYLYKTGGTFTVHGSNLFITPTGTGTGISQQKPANLTFALKWINSSYAIYFLDGNYNIQNIEINKTINLTGIGNAVLNGNGKTIFTIKSNVNITNLHFTNSSLAINNQATTQIINSTFTNNTQHISDSGSLTIKNSQILTNSNSKLTYFYDKKVRNLIKHRNNLKTPEYNLIFIKTPKKN